MGRRRGTPPATQPAEFVLVNAEAEVTDAEVEAFLAIVITRIQSQKLAATDIAHSAAIVDNTPGQV